MVMEQLRLRTVQIKRTMTGTDETTREKEKGKTGKWSGGILEMAREPFPEMELRFLKFLKRSQKPRSQWV